MKPEYTKYQQFLETAKKIRDGGQNYLLSQIPDEVPEDPEKLKLGCDYVLIALGVIPLDAYSVTVIPMFLLDIDKDEADAYAKQFLKDCLAEAA